VGVPERRFRPIVLFEPFGSSSVQYRSKLRLLVGELAQQEVAEQVVIAVPLAMPIERNQKQVQLLERRQRRCGISALEDGVAERTAQFLQHGRAPEKLEQLGRQL
jgi:hypothetical protein